MPNSRTTLRDRVAQAYHDYGRLCSAHPRACLAMSLITMVVLSYPTFTKFRLPVNSPISIYWDSKPYPDPGGKTLSHGLKNTFLQQVVIRGSVDPWVPSNLTFEQVNEGIVGCGLGLEKLRIYV
ncbi:hypothetical protein OESDEN_06797 [Oesophagostomum dentatum]|uniref:Uncharacterized protein n=1 Tax=Oesophagostomum dentatum TaxID=61180 RepID=A0A0B1T7R5_OESDE|nr:hypothetical protein OESDEN_06797 [Oesophagostomum dentatum]